MSKSLTKASSKALELIRLPSVVAMAISTTLGVATAGTRHSTTPELMKYAIRMGENNQDEYEGAGKSLTW